MADDAADGGQTRATKVERLLDRYGLDSAGARLEEYWTADGNERHSLRELETWFNKRLLEQAMREAGMTSIEGEIDNLYRSLTSDDVSSGVRIEARSRLEREGVDVDRLEEDFVSYQAIRTYLKKSRGATHDDRSDREQIAKDRESIQRLRARMSSVTEDKLDRLRETDRITLGEFRLFTEMNVLCEGCGTQYTVEELLDRGGCACSD